MDQGLKIESLQGYVSMIYHSFLVLVQRTDKL